MLSRCVDVDMSCSSVIIALTITIPILSYVEAGKGGGRRAIFRSSSLTNHNKNYGYYGSKMVDNDYNCKFTKNRAFLLQIIKS